jgi:N-methylhydantoinase A
MREMAVEGFAGSAARIERLLDMRYIGQAFELTVPASGDFLKEFHRAHERRYGYSNSAKAAEVVNVRARLVGATPKPELPRMRPGRTGASAATVDIRRAFFGGKPLATPLYNREKLRAGHRFAGPAIVAEYSATTIVPPGWRARIDAFENLILVPSRRRKQDVWADERR